MTKSDLSDLAIAAFEHAVANMPGMRTRAGQVEMVRHVAQSLAPVTLGESEQPIRGICVVNAGTGVGKSLAYAAPGIALAQAMKCRLVLSTATVALQEQILRDLPILSKAMPKPFTFALVKGRSRYFCALKAERIVGGDQDAADLFEEDEKLQADTGKLRRASAQKVTFFRNMAESFRAGTWGDRPFRANWCTSRRARSFTTAGPRTPRPSGAPS